MQETGKGSATFFICNQCCVYLWPFWGYLLYRIYIGCNGNHFVWELSTKMLNVTYVTVSEKS